MNAKYTARRSLKCITAVLCAPRDGLEVEEELTDVHRAAAAVRACNKT